MAPITTPPSAPDPLRFALDVRSLWSGIALGALGAVLVVLGWQRIQAPAAQGQAPQATRSPTRPERPAPPRATETSEENGPNTQINDLLNSADVAFKADLDGCPAVSVAIRLVNNPEDVSGFGPVTSEQRAELKSYAARCGLRF